MTCATCMNFQASLSLRSPAITLHVSDALYDLTTSYFTHIEPTSHCFSSLSLCWDDMSWLCYLEWWSPLCCQQYTSTRLLKMTTPGQFFLHLDHVPEAFRSALQICAWVTSWNGNSRFVIDQVTQSCTMMKRDRIIRESTQLVYKQDSRILQ